METTKVFTSGGSQAVRLPKSCRFDDKEILINRIGSIVLLMPKDDPWGSMLNALNLFTDDFLNEPIEDVPAQERAGL